ncbi:GAP family protein [Cellulosimicrobium cellulans]|uniref:GAP family protein n=1 Tax=Cellulosimicrobium cellulans TaxID=1710 RepID=UPI0008485377|nr:GAP family protein [Cellulosimicrobium cellulans]
MDLPLPLDGFDGSAGLAAMAGVLVVLALIDSTSFGTLLVPVWLLLAPGRLRAGRVLAYLATVAGFYLVVGVVVMLGAGAFLDRFGAALDTRAATIVQLLLGIALFALSFRFDGKRAARRAGSGKGQGRLSRWRERALGIESDAGTTAGAAGTAVVAPARRASVLPLVGLALGAASLEVATMLPYLGAIGIITTSDVAWPASAGILAAYCVVMVAPALLLLLGRLVAARAVDPMLRRLDAWLTKNAAEMTGWVLGVLGVLLALDAMGRLGWT